MGDYKHIETCIGEYITKHNTRAIEVGIGRNTTAAGMINATGSLVGCTDVKDISVPPGIRFFRDDVFSPDVSLYKRADVIYSIRPATEMIPPLITLAQAVDCDLVVYHLGFESWGTGGEKIDCGVILHRYYRRSEPVEKG